MEKEKLEILFENAESSLFNLIRFLNTEMKDHYSDSNSFYVLKLGELMSDTEDLEDFIRILSKELNIRG